MIVPVFCALMVSVLAAGASLAKAVTDRFPFRHDLDVIKLVVEMELPSPPVPFVRGGMQMIAAFLLALPFLAYIRGDGIGFTIFMVCCSLLFADTAMSSCIREKVLKPEQGYYWVRLHGPFLRQYRLVSRLV